MEKSCVLNRERRGLRISVRSSFSGLQIKEGLENAEKAAPYVYIPGELTKESDGYCVYVRQKVSLKEYLAEESINEDIVYCLIRSLYELWNLTQREGLHFYNFLFDYDAVFTDNMCDNMEFIYLPGARLNRQNNSVKDMVTILLLQCMPGDEKISDYLGEIAETIGRWEEEGGSFPEELIHILPERKQLFTIPSEWKVFVWTAAGAFSVAALLFISTDNPIVWPFWLILSVVAVFMAVPDRKNIFCIKRELYLKGGPVFKSGEITVGRDDKWADFHIENLLISRRHAVIIQNEKSLAVRDLFSSNGTYVDGKRLESGEEVILFPGQTVSFGEKYSFCVKSRIGFLFSSR